MSAPPADVAIGAARRADGAARVVGVDFSAAMLTHGLVKVRDASFDPRIQLIRGDAMNLPVAGESVHAATIAFGIRNVVQPEVACRELVRVCVRGPWKASSRTPTHRVRSRPCIHAILPRIGRAVSRHEVPKLICRSRSARFLRREFARIYAAILQVRPAIHVGASIYRSEKCRFHRLQNVPLNLWNSWNRGTL